MSPGLAQEPAPPAKDADVAEHPTPLQTDTEPVSATEAATVRELAPALPLTEVPAGTLIQLRIDEEVNSKTHQTGDWYAISLVQPIILGDRTLVPAGTTGRGQVVHSAKSSWGGKAGELILAARYLDLDGRHVALRGMKLGGVGGNNEGLAFGASVAGGLVAMPLIFALNGRNADIPAGMYATAKLAEPLSGDAPAAASAVIESENARMATINTDASIEMGEPKS